MRDFIVTIIASILLSMGILCLFPSVLCFLIFLAYYWSCRGIGMLFKKFGIVADILNKLNDLVGGIGSITTC